MRKLMGYLPYILGVIIIALIVLLIIAINSDDDQVNTSDKTNTVSDKELTVDGTADNTGTNASETKKNKDKKNKSDDKNEETTPTPDATEITEIPTPTETIDEGEGNEFGLKFDDKQDFVTIKAGSRIRAGASTETGIIKELASETKLERTGYNDSWTRVIYDGMECYVSTSLVISSSNDASTPVPTKEPDKATPTDAPKNNGTYETKSDYVEIKAGSRIRAEASTECEIIDTIQDDMILERTGYSKDWTRVKYNGRECYVSTPLVKRTCDKYGTTVDENGNPVENGKTDNGGTADNQTGNDGTGDGNQGGNNENGNGGEGNDAGNDSTPEPPVTEFKEKNDYVEIKAGSRIRSSATTSSDDNIVTTTTAVSRVKRTGSGSGWARVEYNGQTCYISNSVINCSMTEEQAKAADEAEKNAADGAEGAEGNEE